MGPTLTRRKFFFLGLGLMAGKIIDYSPLVQLVQPTIFQPTKAQIKFLNSTEPLSLYGVPYHVSDTSINQWLGFMRALKKDETL